MEKEKKLFDALHNSNVGTELVEYLKKKQTDICDSRNWGKEDTRESSLIASKTIQEIIDKIVLRQEKKQLKTNNFE